MPSFLDDLQSGLGAQYQLDRELGGGGMSRVFVARDTALGRQVVIKVLPPEMAAAVSAERFRREIQLVARLQHPHIVPVLNAGTANDLLYYTMPFVDGRSLRERLAEGGALPIEDAVGIIREVAGALDYAHAQGLVHRDIKPENVLLSQGHALVTDFGIAKALIGPTSPVTAGEAPAAQATGGGLTTVGMSVGTPSYMAPEQGLGDPSTDHRADLYSLGVMAYELVVGHTPFSSRTTAHALLAAHMLETPPAPSALRPDVPADLDAVIMRCLAKQPADRPATGAEVVAALRGAATTPRALHPAGVTVSGKRARWVWGSMALVALVAAASIGYFLNARFGIGDGWLVGMPRRVATGENDRANDRVTVTTFANETGDRALDPVGRIAADWLTTALAGTGLVKVLDARASLSGSGTSDAASAVTVARELGAGSVVTGSYYRLGDSLQFDVRLIDARTSEVLQVLDPVKGPASDPTAAIELVRQRTLGALASRFNPMLADMAKAGSSPPSYAAYQQIVAGIDDFFAGKPREASVRFARASQLDSANVQARTWLLETLETIGELHTADSVARELESRRDRLSPLEAAQLDEYASSIRAQPDANLAATFRMHALAPNGQWRATLAKKLMSANRWQEAYDTLRAADPEVGLFKDKVFPMEQRRLLLHRLGRIEEELTTIDTLARRFPYPTWPATRARALAALGRTDSLEALVNETAARGGPAVGSSRGLLRQTADELRQHGHAEESRALLERVLASYDEIPADSQRTPAVMRGRAETLVRLGRWKEALDIAMPAVRSDTSIATRISVAMLLARTGDGSRAIAVDAELAAMPPDKYRPGNVPYQRARLAVARGDRSGAIALLREAQAKAYVLFDGTHANYEFESLRGDPAFEALFTRAR